MARGNTRKKGKGSSGQNRKAGEDFLEKNSRKPEVTTLPSELQYQIIDKTDGVVPTDRDFVTVNQRITLTDGTVIKDTYRTGECDTFAVDEAIEGLKEGLQMMPCGSRFKFFVPPHLAWGKRGAGSKIGPNAVIIFDIRLEKVE